MFARATSAVPVAWALKFRPAQQRALSSHRTGQVSAEPIFSNKQ